MSEGLQAAHLVGTMVVPVPMGWSCQQQLTLRLPSSDAVGEFEPSIVVLHEPLGEGTELDAVVDQRRRALARHLPQFELDLSTIGDLLGHRVVRLMYTWVGGPHRLRQMLVLLPVGDSLYTFTYTDLSSRFADSVSAFDTWLATVGFHQAVTAEPAE